MSGNTQLFRDCRDFYVTMHASDGTLAERRMLEREFDDMPPVRRIAMENAMLELGERIAKRLKK